MAKSYNGRGMRMGGGGMNMNMVRQAQKMQADMERMQTELETKPYTAKSGGGAVTAVVDGKRTLTRLTILPDAVNPEDVELLQDMVLTAVNEALRLAGEDASKSMSRVTGGGGQGKVGL